MGISKIILDDVLNLENTNYVYADYLQNSYFIGNKSDEKIYQNFENAKRKRNNLFKFKDSNFQKIQFSEENIPSLDINFENMEIPLSYIHSKTDCNLFDYAVHNLADKEIEITKEFELKEILDLMINYIGENFSEKINRKFKKYLRRENWIISSNRYSRLYCQTEYRKKEDIFIYAPLAEGNILYFIHELFHVVYYLMGERDSMKHEYFVYKHMLHFVLEKEVQIHFPTFALKYLDYLKRQYRVNFICLEYLKHLYLDNLSSFFNQYSSYFNGDYREFISVLNEVFKDGVDFNKYKYVAATEQLAQLIYRYDKQLME